MKIKFYFVIAGILLFFTSGINSSFGQQCGPGAHWIDNCAGGSDIMESGALVGVNFNLANCNLPPEVNITLSGPVTVQRQAAQDIMVTDGICPATVDGHTDVIPTEIISMNLTGSGYTLIVGPSGAPELQHTFGYVVEKPADTTLGCSFFDVWFKIITPSGPLYNQTPLRLEATIDRVPPSVTYYSPVGICLGLYTSPVPGEGMLVANLVQAQHEVIFIIPTLSQWGLIILALLLLSLGMVFVPRSHTALLFVVVLNTDVKLSLFNRSLYFKALGIVLLFAVTGLVVVYWNFGTLSKADLFGTLVSAGIVAYMVQMWMIMRRK